MSSIDLAKIQDLIIDTATDVGIKVLGAIALWVIGRWLIGLTLRMVRGGLERQHIDPTVVRYVGSIVSVTLNILLVV
jgi:small conductance mechanosensitive channel